MNSESSADQSGESLDKAPQLAVPELVPIAEFLQQSLPFNELPLKLLYQTVDKIVVQYHCRS